MANVVPILGTDSSALKELRKYVEELEASIQNGEPAPLAVTLVVRYAKGVDGVVLGYTNLTEVIAGLEIVKFNVLADPDM